MTEQRERTPMSGELEKSFLKYTFFKVAREWRSLNDSAKSESSAEFLHALESSGSRLSFFSLVGIRGDTDFMILAESPDLDSLQALGSGILATKFGGYLEVPYSYLAMTRKSKYLGSHRHPEQEGAPRGGPASKFLFVYPFVKKREWYRLPFPERQRIMAEHFKLGLRYPSIRIKTGYSFGLDD